MVPKLKNQKQNFTTIAKSSLKKIKVGSNFIWGLATLFRCIPVSARRVHSWLVLGEEPPEEPGSNLGAPQPGKGPLPARPTKLQPRRTVARFKKPQNARGAQAAASLLRPGCNSPGTCATRQGADPKHLHVRRRGLGDLNSLRLVLI